MNEQVRKDDFHTHAAKELETLLTRITDTLHGFDKILEEAEESFVPLAHKFRRLHAEHADHLMRMMTDAGVFVGNPESFMSKVNEVVITARAHVTDIDHSILAQIRSGEKHVLDAFDEATTAVHSAELRDTLNEMRGELASLVDSTRTAD